MPVSLKEVNFKLPVTAQPIRSVMGSEWIGKLVAPLPAPALSKEGMGAIADRVKYIGLFAIATLIATVIFIAIRFAHSKIYSDPNSADPKLSSLLPGPSTAQPQTSTKTLLNFPEFQPGQIKDDFTNLHGHFEILSNDLFGSPRLIGEGRERSIDQFTTHMRGFEQRYQALRGTEDARDTFQKLSVIKKSFLHMADIAHGIIRVPGDGNCLFYCIGQALKQMSRTNDLNGIWDDKFSNDQQLREHIVEWMRQNINKDPALKKEIDGAITRFIDDKKRSEIPNLEANIAHFKRVGNEEKAAEDEKTLQALRGDLTKLQSVEKYPFYFEKINQPRFFAGDAEIYAATQIFGVGFIVQKEYEGKIIAGFETGFNEQAPLKITVVYRNDDHFDWQNNEDN